MSILKKGQALILMGIGLFLLISCLSYDASDTSLNTISDQSIQNWMGIYGAYAADLVWQSFGMMGMLVIVAGISWGVLIIKEKSIKGRSLTFLLSVLLGCWLLATQKVSGESAYFKAGKGGFIGFYFSQWLMVSIHWVRVCLWGIWGALMIYALAIPVQKIASFCVQIIPALAKLKPAVRQAEKVVLPLQKIKIVPKREKKSASKKKISTVSASLKERVVISDQYQLPSSQLLTPAKVTNTTISKETIEMLSRALENNLSEYGITGEIVGASPGPVVTLYEFEPAAGIKTSRVIALSDEIARLMCVVSVRIAVIPGSNYIGIEMPNPKRDMVYIRELVESDQFQKNEANLPIILGKDIGGKPMYADLTKMPHLLVAGTTGSGKSVAINTMILSLLYRFTPQECRLILVDPKMVELSVYNNIPHLLTPVVTEAPKAVVALKWAVREMEDRYRAMSQLGVRNIDGYNQKLVQAAREGRTIMRRVQTGFNPETGEPVIEEQALDLTPIPYIVMIVDEMSDLMGQCGKEAEPPILRLAQMARAVGIHLILATQRPSVDVITGLIKANFPSRISFQVSNKIDSRTILDEQGAELLLGRGDMLYRPAGSKPIRIHGPFVSDEEVEQVVHHWRLQGEPKYLDAVITDTEEGASGNAGGGSYAAGGSGAGDGGDLYDRAVAIILRDHKVSTSYVQRQLRIGYNRAADLIDKMEAEGIISKPNLSGKREILVPTDNA